MDKSGTKSDTVPRSTNRFKSIANLIPRKLSSRDASPDTASLPYSKRDSNKFSLVFSKVAGKSNPESIIRSNLSRASSSSSLGYVAWDYGPEQGMETASLGPTFKGIHTIDQEGNTPLRGSNSLLKKFSWRSRSSSEKSSAINTEDFGFSDSRGDSRPASPKASSIGTKVIAQSEIT